jgi:hypothetical protein
MQRVETKVSAATLAAAISGAIVWALSAYVFAGAVPDGLRTLIDVVIPAAVTFAAGWASRHTPRETPIPPSAGSPEP